MHAALHPLHQTQWDKKTERLGGQQASSITANTPVLTRRQTSSIWVFYLSAGWSTRLSTWVCGKTYVWEELDLHIAESLKSFWWGEFNAAHLPTGCVISVQLGWRQPQPQDLWMQDLHFFHPGMPFWPLRRGLAGGVQSSRASFTSSALSTWTTISTRWAGLRSSSRILNRYQS